MRIITKPFYLTMKAHKKNTCYCTLKTKKSWFNPFLDPHLYIKTLTRMMCRWTGAVLGKKSELTIKLSPAGEAATLWCAEEEANDKTKPSSGPSVNPTQGDLAFVGVTMTCWHLNQALRTNEPPWCLHRCRMSGGEDAPAGSPGVGCCPKVWLFFWKC